MHRDVHLKTGIKIDKPNTQAVRGFMTDTLLNYI